MNFSNMDLFHELQSFMNCSYAGPFQVVILQRQGNLWTGAWSTPLVHWVLSVHSYSSHVCSLLSSIIFYPLYVLSRCYQHLWWPQPWQVVCPTGSQQELALSITAEAYSIFSQKPLLQYPSPHTTKPLPHKPSTTGQLCWDTLSQY